MPYHINSDCVACGNCSVVCPRDAVDDGYTYHTKGDINSTTDVVMDGAMVPEDENEGLYRITKECDNCGKCVDVCPVHAIEY